MKNKSLILAVLVLFIMMTAIFSWYEGSGLMDDPHQWEYTALISGWMDDGEVLGKSEISQFDFFLYAIKFHPLFPSSMMVFFSFCCFS
ncbi:DUF4306 domain-containing protein [Bacillus sp. SG-1]|uniref:DUF4306 domain-containing protein n=1 Tax=Bacillus sp. SG-1 TaxID=161544 RepID=UPI00015434B4|nr:DUF4306 domain-containing protein [Bacillus sp. SG-1]EDL66313.1 hypothetical protein BSG1_03135 [Bacillus sp. SG-1]